MYSFLHGLLVQSYTFQQTNVHTKDTGTVDNTIAGSIPHCCLRFCIQRYKLALQKKWLDLQMFFSELKKYSHKTEGNELKHAAVAHTNHTVI